MSDSVTDDTPPTCEQDMDMKPNLSLEPDDNPGSSSLTAGVKQAGSSKENVNFVEKFIGKKEKVLPRTSTLEMGNSGDKNFTQEGTSDSPQQKQIRTYETQIEKLTQRILELESALGLSAKNQLPHSDNDNLSDVDNESVESLSQAQKRERVEALSQTIKEKDEIIESLRRSLQEQEEQYKSKTTKLEETIRRLEGEKNAMRSNHLDTKRKNVLLREQLNAERNNTSRVDREEELQRTKSQLADSTNELQRVNEQLRDRTEQLERSSRAANEAQASSRRDREEIQTRAQATQHDLESSMDDLRHRLENCFAELQQTQSQLADCANELQCVKEQLLDRTEQLLHVCTLLTDLSNQLEQSSAANGIQAAEIRELQEQIVRHQQETARFDSDRVFVLTPEQERAMDDFRHRLQDLYLRMRAADRRQILEARASQILAEQRAEAVEARIGETRDQLTESDAQTIESLQRNIRQRDALLAELGRAQAPQNVVVNQVVINQISSDNSMNVAAINTNNNG